MKEVDDSEKTLCMWLVLRECKEYKECKENVKEQRNMYVAKWDFAETNAKEESKRKSKEVFYFFFKHICNLNIQNQLEIKNMKHVAIIPLTLELDCIAHVESFVPSQRGTQMTKHQENLSLWVWLPPVHVSASLCLFKKKNYMEVIEIYLIKKKKRCLLKFIMKG